MNQAQSTNVPVKKTGIAQILKYLGSGRSLTALESLANWGIFRLAAAVHTLRSRGHNIISEIKEDPNGKTYAVYTMGPKEVAEVVRVPATLETLKVGDKVRVSFPEADAAPTDLGKEGVVMEIQAHLPFPIFVGIEKNVEGTYVFKASELEVI